MAEIMLGRKIIRKGPNNADVVTTEEDYPIVTPGQIERAHAQGDISLQTKDRLYGRLEQDREDASRMTRDQFINRYKGK